MPTLTRFPALLSLLLLLADSSFAFSLKNCTIRYADANVRDVDVECVGRFLAAIPDDLPRNATSLDVTDNSIVRISKTDLRGLSELSGAQFDANLISHIDDGAFADLAKLKKLFINNNRLTILTDDLFRGLRQLKELCLCDNKISVISALAFRSLVSIRLIDLGKNHLCQMTDVVPALQLPTLEILQLEFNNLDSLELDGRSVGVSNVRSLDLSINRLTKFSLTEDVVPKLEDLSLDECGVTQWNVANKTFLRSLNRLTLRGSSIGIQTYFQILESSDSIGELDLDSVETALDFDLVQVACQNLSLNILRFTGIKIGSLNTSLLRSCSRLTKLNLCQNQISHIPPDAFQSLTRLTTLLLGSNILAGVPKALATLSALQSLDLSSNFISELHCQDFRNLSALKRLNLNLNYISRLQRCFFENLKELEDLNIGRNPFFYVGDVFKVNLHNLKSLALLRNQLRFLRSGDFRNLSSLLDLNIQSEQNYAVQPEVFDGLRNLVNLSLTMTYLDKTQFIGLSNLETLDVHLKNILQTNDHAPFIFLPKLKKLLLKVSNAQPVFVESDLLLGLNSLEAFMADGFFKGSVHPDTFEPTPRLRRLQMTHSSLSDLSPEVFRPIPALEELDLSNNDLKSLDFLSGVDLTALRFLNLNRNQLSVVDSSVLASLAGLTYLDLDKNPFTCQCSNSDAIQRILNDNRTQVVNAYRYTCAFPVSQRGDRFLDFDVGSCRLDVNFVCFVSSASLITSFLVSSSVYHFLRWQLTYAFYFLLAFLYDRRRRTAREAHRYDAFVSYNVRDEAWVYQELLPVLETQQGWTLCLHHRDFQPGKLIVENIVDAIYSSRKTLCVISRNYLQSEWCSAEIQMASFRLLDERRDVVVLLFLEDLPSNQLAPYYRLKSLLKKKSYLRWADAAKHRGLFWENVRRALMTEQSGDDQPRLLTQL